MHAYFVLAGAEPVLVHNMNLDCLTIADSHIVFNHTPEGFNNNDASKTEWLPGTTQDSRAKIIKEVLSEGREVHDTKNRDGKVFEFRYSDPIGYDRKVPRNKLYVMRVYYDPDENHVKKAFPVKR
ncbi:hypothetical protein ACIQ7Q_10755 [Streptomyces sp. NPDC096176]|uniref:hypothetical protein n=1 Tax=Streptomyces sp. NPDC096176 TaxID=3366079 RepID=UPI0037F6B231